MSKVWTAFVSESAQRDYVMTMSKENESVLVMLHDVRAGVCEG